MLRRVHVQILLFYEIVRDLFSGWTSYIPRHAAVDQPITNIGIIDLLYDPAH